MPHYINETLAVVVIGASGDLAKRKTYMSLFKLFFDDLLPPKTITWGFGDSKPRGSEIGNDN
jgi:glucose-6-phosphate 1-dehydrogenase